MTSVSNSFSQQIAERDCFYLTDNMLISIQHDGRLDAWFKMNILNVLISAGRLCIVVQYDMAGRDINQLF